MVFEVLYKGRGKKESIKRIIASDLEEAEVIANKKYKAWIDIYMKQPKRRYA